MAVIDKNKKSAADRAIETKPPMDGAHSTRARKAIKKENQENEPAYIVAVVKQESSEEGKEPKAKSFYRPEEIRAKARALLSSGKLDRRERDVLEEILGPEPEKNKNHDRNV